MTAQIDEAEVHKLCSDLIGGLAQADSGIKFIYDILDRVAEEWELEDLVLVVDEPPAGRQTFRMGRRPVSAHWSPDQIQTAEPGLYDQPQKLDAFTSQAVKDVCSVALRLDLLHHDASHDPLTSLHNRRSFEQMLRQAIGRSERHGWPFALIIFDLNNFKGLNDSLGHAVGDAILRAIGDELRHSLRAGDVAARIGGDEFALIINEGTPAMLDSLLDRLSKSVSESGGDVGFSAGIAVAPAESTDPDELQLLADKRLYEAKAKH